MKATTGVYFERRDYANFWVRLLVDLIDVLVFGVICALLALPVILTFPPNKSTFNLLLLICLAVAFSYFVVLKRSRWRTLGYRLCRVRIVGLDGRAPGYPSLTLRLMFGLLGPFNWLLDLAWLSGDPHRQALRDKFANTYVVKRNARPTGQGRIVIRHYDIGIYNLMFREVEFDQSTGEVSVARTAMP
jgi:uncharacterized RDD family membrane protein YckC